MTRFCRLFVILPVHFRVAQLDLQSADHSAVQADDAMLTLDSGSVSLTCSVRGESVVSRRSDSFHTRYFGSSLCDGGSTRHVSSGMPFWHVPSDLLRSRFTLNLLAFTIRFLAGLRFLLSCCLGKFCNVFVYRVYRCEKCSASTGLHSFSCLLHSFQSADHDVRMNIFFFVNACLCCSSVSNLLPAIFSCRAILLRHTLRLSDCPTNSTLLILTLSLLLMLYASTLSAILYSAAAADNLMSASSRSTAPQSSDSSSLASNTWLVAPLPLLQILRALLLFLTTCLVLCCGLLSF